MQNLLKYFIIGALFVLSSLINVNAQFIPKSLTNYKSERKSLNLIDQQKEFLLVEYTDYLSVMSVNDNGQLYTVYISKTPYCHDASIINVVMNDEYILFYYGSHIILENFITGQIRKLDNIPTALVNKYPRAYFLNSYVYVLKLDSDYLYDINTDKLLKNTDRNYIMNHDLLYYFDFNTNETVVELFQQNKELRFFGNKTSYHQNFDGLIFQSPASHNSSSENRIYFVYQDGTVDTIVDNFPLFDVIDKDPNDHHILMAKKDAYENKLLMYKYDTDTKSLVTLDTLMDFYEHDGNFINDSIFYFNKWYSLPTIYNLNSKKTTTISQCDYSMTKHKNEFLLFEDYGLAPFIYDIKHGKISKLINESYEGDIYFTHIKKGEKLFLVDFQYLNLPYYELSDTVYTHRQQNEVVDDLVTGIRTSLLKESKNYLFTFDDDDILVVDTNETNGFRKKKIVEHKSILGTLKGVNWFVNEDDIYGVIPVIKTNKTYFDLIKVNLNSLTITNISERIGWVDTLQFCQWNSPIKPVNYYSNDFLVLNKRLLDLKTNEAFQVPDSLLVLPYRNINSAMLMKDRLLAINENKILTFSYPEFKHLRTIDIKNIMCVRKDFLIYSRTGNDNLIYYDGVKDEILLDTEGFTAVSVYSPMKDDDPFVLINSKTKKIRICSINRDVNGGILLEKVFEDDYTKSQYPAQLNGSNFMSFSFNLQENLYSYIYDLKTKNTFRISGIGWDDIIYYNGDTLICMDNRNNQMKKMDLDGNIIQTARYPENTKFIYNLRNANYGHAGLFVFERINYRSDNSKLFFDATAFEFIFDTECIQEYYKYSSFGENLVYKDDAYYFNAELDGRGRQIYKLDNPNADNSTFTIDERRHTVSVYPNPANDWLEIKTNEHCDLHSIKVLDILGNTLVAQDCNCKAQIDISQLEQGAYFLLINFANETKTIKFVKI
jgi:hypothetical protein